MTVLTTYAAEFVQSRDLASTSTAMEIIGLEGGGLAGLGDDGANVDATIFNAALASIGGVDNVAGNNGALAQLADGNIVIAAESGGTINYRIVDGVGATVRADSSLAPDVGLTLGGAAGLAGGGFVLAATDLVAAGNNDIEMKLFTAAGDEDLSVAVAISSANDYGGVVTALNDGGFAVAWTRDVGGGTTQAWRAVYNGDGSVRTAADVFDSNGTVNRNMSIMSLANGGYVVAYEDSTHTGSFTKISLARFTAAGTFQGVIQATPLAGVDTDPALTRLSNGMIALTYTRELETGNQDVYLQLFAANPTGPLLPSAQALMNGAGQQFDSSVAQLDMARLAVSATGASVDVRTYQVVRTSAGDSAADSVTGDDAVDRMSGGDGADTLQGMGNNDELLGDNGFDRLDGGDGDDTLEGGANGDTLVGGQGADVLDDGGGADSVTGGAGDDFVLGGFGPDTLVGGPGTDTLFYFYMAGETFLDLGGSAPQNTHSAGLDSIIGFENATTGDGDDRVLGSGQANVIQTLNGADTIKAADGADDINAGDGIDKVNGGGGDDTITGGGGADRMLGGRDADSFLYQTSSDAGLGAEQDVIRDFRTADGDRIVLSGLAFGMTYVGAAAFDGTGAQVRVEAIAAGQLVQVDTDGDGNADMEILVTNSGLAGGASDFVV